MCLQCDCTDRLVDGGASSLWLHRMWQRWVIVLDLPWKTSLVLFPAWAVHFCIGVDVEAEPRREDLMPLVTGSPRSEGSAQRQRLSQCLTRLPSSSGENPLFFFFFSP